MGGVSTWLGDHLGIRRVVDTFGLLFGLDSSEEVAMRLHLIDGSVLGKVFSFAQQQVDSKFEHFGVNTDQYSRCYHLDVSCLSFVG